MRHPAIHLGFVSAWLLFTSPAATASTEVKVLLTAPPHLPGCPLTVYRSEREVPASYEKLCSIKAEATTIFKGFDQTGKALEEVPARACLCGANAVLILSNSSDTQPTDYSARSVQGYGSVSTSVRAYRKSEVVTAVALRVAAPPPPPMPPNEMKAGFRDLAWGDPPSESFRPLEGEDPQEPLRRFVRPSDELLLAKTPVQPIRYSFSDSKLCRVEISFQMTRWQQLRDALSTLWGAPQRCEDGAKPSCTWWANMVEGAGGTIAILAEGDGEFGNLVIGNPELLNQAQKKKKEAEAGL